MKLVMTLVVRNEADVIRTNLEYHLAQGVDFVIVTDHGSDDGTSEILREYERVGVAKVIRDERDGHRQEERVMRMVDIARVTHKADWVINNDADEFWWPLLGSLRDVFAHVPARFGQIEVMRRNFRPIADANGARESELPFHSRLVYRETISSNLPGYALEPKVAHRPVAGVVVAPGNHSIDGTELAAWPAHEMLEIFHFPMRSYEQFERKVLQTGLGYEQLSDRAPQVGCDQLALLERHRKGTLREYYDGLALDDVSLERGLQLGTLAEDRRLDDFIGSLRTGGKPSRRSDDRAQALLERITSAIDRVEVDREEAERRRAELDELRAATETLRTERDALREEGEAVRAENETFAATIARSQEDLARSSAALDETAGRLNDVAQELQSEREALHLLRTSRLMRYTGPLRRAFYRVKRSGD